MAKPSIFHHASSADRSSLETHQQDSPARRKLPRVHLSLKFLFLFFVLFVVIALISTVVTVFQQEDRANRELLEKARTINAELSANWDFINLNEERINTDADGNYEFKGIYCVVAAKSAAKFLENSTGYTVRYTDLDVRNPHDAPDAFETDALQIFAGEPRAIEYYQLTERDGHKVFRYMVPLRIETSCLNCHGTPAGEADPLGQPKEGLKVGDLAGARSIIMPANLTLGYAQAAITQQIIMVLAVFAASSVIIFVAIRHLVTRPLEQVKQAVAKVEQGEFDVDLVSAGHNDEITDLAQSFQQMSVELNKLYEGLETQVRLRTENLSAANAMLVKQREQLAHANELLKQESDYKTDFLMVMSHNLKTPLTSILAFSEMLIKTASATDEQTGVALREIQENVHILMQTIDNILDLGRAEAHMMTLNPEVLDLDDLFNAIMQTMTPIAQKRDINLTSRVAADVPCITADWEKLRRAIENLVSNAIKYTEPGGTVQLIAFLDDTGKSVIMQVCDTGIGIRSEDIDGIFERFVQGDPRGLRDYHGSGIGLCIVREIIQLHGAEISVASTLNVGTTFTITMHIAGDQS